MKWETLKRKIADEIDAHPDTKEAQEMKREAQGQGTNIHGYLRTYDIRAVGALRDRFPQVFPAYLRRGMLYLNHDEKGNWTIDDKAKL